MRIVCADRDRLRTSYRAFLSDYRRSLQVLEKYTGMMSKDEYGRILAGTDAAFQLWKKAQSELAAHLSEHNCDQDEPQTRA